MGRKGRLIVLVAVCILVVTLGAAGMAAEAGENVSHLLYLPVVERPLPGSWARAYGEPGAWANFSAVVPVEGGLVAGGQLDFDRWLVRLEKDGGIEWQKGLPEQGPKLHPVPVRGLAAVPGGGVMVASLAEDYASGYELAVLELSAGGEISWQKRYKTVVGVNELVSWYVDIRATAGMYYVASNLAFVDPDDQDPWLLKLGETGEIVWQKRYQSEGWDEITAMAATGDGGVAVAGTKGDSGALWVLKVDAGGAVVWQKVYGERGGLEPCTPTGIAPTADQGFIVAGFSNPYEVGGGCLMKLMAGGEVSWARRYDVDGQEGFESVGQTADGGYVASGTVWPSGSDRGIDAWLVRVDGGGKVLWANRYGGNDEDGAYVVQPEGDGFLVLGRTSLVEDGGLLRKGLVMKVAGNGQIEDCDLVRPTGVVVTERVPVVSETGAVAVDTGIGVDDPGLVTWDRGATMVVVCPVGGRGCETGLGIGD